MNWLCGGSKSPAQARVSSSRTRIRLMMAATSVLNLKFVLVVLCLGELVFVMIFDFTSISNFDLLVTIGTCGEGTFIFFACFFYEGEGAADLNWRFNVGASMKSSSDNANGAVG